MKLLYFFGYFSIFALLICGCGPKKDAPTGSPAGTEADSQESSGSAQESESPWTPSAEDLQKMCEFKTEYMESDEGWSYNSQGQIRVTSEEAVEIPEVIDTGGWFSTDFEDQGQKKSAGTVIWTYKYENTDTYFREKWCPEGVVIHQAIPYPKDCFVEVIYKETFLNDEVPLSPTLQRLKGKILDDEYTGALTIEVHFSGKALTFSHCDPSNP